MALGPPSFIDAPARVEPSLEGVLFVAWTFPDPKRPEALAWLEAVPGLGVSARVLAALGLPPKGRAMRESIAARAQYLLASGARAQPVQAERDVRYVHAVELAALPLAHALARQLGVPFGFDCDARALAAHGAPPSVEVLLGAQLVLTDCAHVARRLHARAPGAVVELARRGIALRRMETPSEPPRAGTELLALGPLTLGGGVHRLCEGLAIARARGLTARLTVFGEGPQHASLLRLIAALRLETSVRIVPPASQLEAGALRGAEVIIAPALDEASVHAAALEAAFASGRPVIASDLPTHRELMQPDASEPNGWLVARDDPRAIAAALEAVCADPLGARRRGRQARRYAERVLDLERNARARAERLRAAAYPQSDPRVSSEQRAVPRAPS